MRAGPEPGSPASSGPDRRSALAQLRTGWPIVAGGIGLYIVDGAFGPRMALILLAVGVAVWALRKRPRTETNDQ